MVDMNLAALGAIPANQQPVQSLTGLGQPTVMSDAMPDPVSAGQQYAQSSPIQMRPIGNGQVQVINIRTGQILYTGSAAGAANAQASGAGAVRRIID